MSCKHTNFGPVKDSRKRGRNFVYRRRTCGDCGELFSTVEVAAGSDDLDRIGKSLALASKIQSLPLLLRATLYDLVRAIGEESKS